MTARRSLPEFEKNVPWPFQIAAPFAPSAFVRSPRRSRLALLERARRPPGRRAAGHAPGPGDAPRGLSRLAVSPRRHERPSQTTNSSELRVLFRCSHTHAATRHQPRRALGRRACAPWSPVHHFFLLSSARAPARRRASARAGLESRLAVASSRVFVVRRLDTAARVAAPSFRPLSRRRRPRARR